MFNNPKTIDLLEKKSFIFLDRFCQNLTLVKKENV